MYRPEFKTKQNGVPILSKNEIDFIGEALVRDFMPNVLTSPEPVDIEAFLEYHLGMTMDYQYLSNNCIYLGMTVFNDTNSVVIYSPSTNRAEYISVKANTVIIDNSLLDKKQNHRYRFTLGHEGGHAVLHSGYFTGTSDRQPPQPCRLDSSAVCSKKYGNRSDHDWLEWQANCFASSILMPKSAVDIVASRYPDQKSNVFHQWLLINDIMDTFDVSYEAAVYRLRNTGYFYRNDYSSLLTLMNLPSANI